MKRKIEKGREKERMKDKRKKRRMKIGKEWKRSRKQVERMEGEKKEKM